MYSSKLVFEGISVDIRAFFSSLISSIRWLKSDIVLAVGWGCIDGDGKQYNMDATVAYKQAALNAIAYLMKVCFDSSLSSFLCRRNVSDAGPWLYSSDSVRNSSSS